MTKASEPRRHHYVPRCWLAGFTETGETGGRLWVTDFSRRKQWPSTPDGAGHMRDFYRLSNDDAPDPLVVETFYSKLEADTAPVFRSIDAERRVPRNDEFELLLEFMSYQAVRTPAFRPVVRNLSNRIARETLAKYLKDEDSWKQGIINGDIDPNAPCAEFEKAKESVEQFDWNAEVENNWYLAQASKAAISALAGFQKRIWHTVISEQGRFIASDNPVVLDGSGMIGFSNAEIVFYPVSRHVLIAGALTRLPDPAQSVRFFAYLNTMTLLRTEAQVFSHSNDFVWLDENTKVQDDWRLFDKVKILNSVRAGNI